MVDVHWQHGRAYAFPWHDWVKAQARKGGTRVIFGGRRAVSVLGPTGKEDDRGCLGKHGRVPRGDAAPWVERCKGRRAESGAKHRRISIWIWAPGASRSNLAAFARADLAHDDPQLHDQWQVGSTEAM